MVNSAAASSSQTAAPAFTDEASNINVVQAYEIKILTAALQELGENRVNFQAQLASLASKPRHCPDVGKLMVDMGAVSFAGTQSSKRIHDMELVLACMML